MKVLALLLTLLTIANTVYARNIWFSDITSPLTINNKLANQLFLYIKNPENNSIPVNDTLPRIVFISHSKPLKTAKTYMGRGLGLKAALNEALTVLPKDTIEENDWLKLDIVQSGSNRLNYTNTIGKYDISLYGLAFPANSNIAILPEEISIHRLVNEDNSINEKKLQTYLKNRNNKSFTKPNHIFRFISQSYFHENNTTIPLFRGHPANRTITRNSLLTDSTNIGSYLSNNISSTGKYNYLYRADNNAYASSYNILRHAGSTAALLDLYRHTRHENLLSPITRSTAYLVSHIKSCNPPFDNPQSSCVIHNKKIKLGGNALAIIAIARYIELTKDSRYQEKIIQLGNWITETQTANGRFSIHKQYASSGKISDFVSEYYPGEATLALIELYKITGRKRWLTSAIAAANYIIETQNRLDQEKLPHDHWFLYALNDLYRIKPNPIYLEHAKKLTKNIMNKQNLKPTSKDWLGSYYIPPRSAPTATRTEGLIAAYKLFDYANDDYKSQIKPHISNGISFLANTLYSNPSLMYLPEPYKAQYGVRRSLISHEIRIDYCQHNISSFLGYIDMLKK